MVEFLDVWRKGTTRLLANFNAEDLFKAFIWSSTPQGDKYWRNIYLDLRSNSGAPSERIEEAKGHIRKMLGFVDPSEEAEWE